MYARIRDGAGRQLDVLVHLLAAKALLDAGHPLPPNLRNFNVDLKVEGRDCPKGVTCADALEEMGDRFACWPTSPIMAAIRHLLAAAPAQAFENLYLACVMGSAGFARALAASREATEVAGLADKLQAVLCAAPGHPSQLVDASSRAGAVLHGKLLRSRPRLPNGLWWRTSHA